MAFVHHLQPLALRSASHSRGGKQAALPLAGAGRAQLMLQQLHYPKPRSQAPSHVCIAPDSCIFQHDTCLHSVVFLLVHEGRPFTCLCLSASLRACLLCHAALPCMQMTRVLLQRSWWILWTVVGTAAARQAAALKLLVTQAGLQCRRLQASTSKQQSQVSHCEHMREQKLSITHVLGAW
jgi:hypothetical protein